MNVVLLRVGIDTGSGGMHGPLFADGSFEYIPIPDTSGSDERTYGTLFGRRETPLINYFPPSRQLHMTNHPIHVDPEFATRTYGDPGLPKASLRKLAPGDMLVFYAGLRGWDFPYEPALYIIGYFEVQTAGLAKRFNADELQALFAANFHVRHPALLAAQHDALVLVKGTPASRLLHRAVRISEVGENRAGKPLHILSKSMRERFGEFNGHLSIQRSPPRWVAPDHVAGAAAFVRLLE